MEQQPQQLTGLAAAVNLERQKRQQDAVAAAQSSGWFALLPLSRSAAASKALRVPRSIMLQWQLKGDSTHCVLLPSDGLQLHGTIYKHPRGSGKLKQGWVDAGLALGGLQIGDLLQVRSEPGSFPLRVHLALTRNPMLTRPSPVPQPQMAPPAAPLIVTADLVITEEDCHTGQLTIPGAAWEALCLGRHIAGTACDVTLLLSGESFSGTISSSGSSSGFVSQDSISRGGALVTGWSQAGKALGVTAGDILFLRVAKGVQPLNLHLHSIPTTPNARRMSRQQLERQQAREARQQQEQRLESFESDVGRHDVAPREGRSLLLPPRYDRRQAAQVSSPGSPLKHITGPSCTIPILSTPL